MGKISDSFSPRNGTKRILCFLCSTRHGCAVASSAICSFNFWIFIGMILTAIAGLVFNLLPMPDGIVSKVPSIAPTFGAAFEGFLNPSELFNVQFLVVVLTFLFVDFFDTAGTLVGIASQANLIK